MRGGGLGGRLALAVKLAGCVLAGLRGLGPRALGPRLGGSGALLGLLRVLAPLLGVGRRAVACGLSCADEGLSIGARLGDQLLGLALGLRDPVSPALTAASASAAARRTASSALAWISSMLACASPRTRSTSAACCSIAAASCSRASLARACSAAR